MLSSLCVGAIPSSLGRSLGKVDWVPIDILAEVVGEMALGDDGRGEMNVTHQGTLGGKEGVRVFHAVNPHPVSWSGVRETIVSAIEGRMGKRLEVVSLQAWIEAVKRHGREHLREDAKLEDGEVEAYLRVNPALKLVGFYEGVLDDDGGEGEERTEWDDERDTGMEEGRWALERSMEASKSLREMQGVKSKWVRKWVGEWMDAIDYGKG